MSIANTRRGPLSSLSRSIPGPDTPSVPVKWPYIDTLYDYVEFMGYRDASQNVGSIASLPKAHWNTPVAVIGAGAAGLVAVYELLKIGALPVVFEAHPQRLGGRLYSQPFSDAEGKPDPTTLAEMGALAGDSVSWSGGWIEGAMQTGINAACAAAKRIGAHLKSASPLCQSPHLYSYTSLPIQTMLGDDLIMAPTYVKRELSHAS